MRILKPASRCSRSMVRCPTAPTPSAPQVNLSGSALASAMNSCSVFAGMAGLMPTAIGTVPKLEIGVKSFTTSYVHAHQHRRDDEQRWIDQQRVAVRRASRHLDGADRAARAGDVLDDERLPELLLEELRHRARDDVGQPAGRGGHHHAHRSAKDIAARWRCRRRSTTRAPRRIPRLAQGSQHLFPPRATSLALHRKCYHLSGSLKALMPRG